MGLLEEFEMIRHPFNIDKVREMEFNKINHTYETRIVNIPASKRIFARPVKKNCVYYHVEVNNNTQKITGTCANLYVFDIPADFYIPVMPGTTETYEKIYKGIMSEDIRGLVECADNFVKLYHYGTEELLPYPPPVVSNMDIASYSKFVESTSNRTRTTNAQVVKYGDAVPDKPLECCLSLIKESKESEFDVVEYLRKLFDRYPIMRMEYIKKMYNADIPREIRIKFTHNRLKVLVPTVAYFMNSGPWVKTWIRFGFNEFDNPSIYKYQVLSLKEASAFFQIFENKEVLELIQRNVSTFISDRSNPKTGFLTPRAMIEIRKLLKGKLITREKEDDLSDFEVYV